MEREILQFRDKSCLYMFTIKEKAWMSLHDLKWLQLKWETKAYRDRILLGCWVHYMLYDSQLLFIKIIKSFPKRITPPFKNHFFFLSATMGLTNNFIFHKTRDPSRQTWSSDGTTNFNILPSLQFDVLSVDFHFIYILKCNFAYGTPRYLKELLIWK